MGVVSIDSLRLGGCLQLIYSTPIGIANGIAYT